MRCTSCLRILQTGVGAVSGSPCRRKDRKRRANRRSILFARLFRKYGREKNSGRGNLPRSLQLVRKVAALRQKDAGGNMAFSVRQKENGARDLFARAPQVNGLWG